MLETIERRFREAAPAVEFCSLRYVRDRSQRLRVRQDVLEPVETTEDAGAMVTVVDRGGLGYAATSDLTASGLREAAARAVEWARRTAGRTVADLSGVVRSLPVAEYRTPVRVRWEDVPLGAKLDLVREECRRLHTEERIVDWFASLWHTSSENLHLTADGGRVRQDLCFLVPNLGATAHDGREALTRTLGAEAWGRQGGMEVLDAVGFRAQAPRIAAEALELLVAPDCPTGRMDLLLDADQMVLQIHESIGHPLELDRILGDERNYAGTSFVTPDMFGRYRYGSDLLNITFDPGRPEQLASYAFDDEGQPARREFVIRDGILLRPLGGATSQARAGLAGVANARASSWNRPPIDRMANLNLEPGRASLEEMVRAVRRGVYMRTNCSWSIDDSRNKFQFGCEWGRLIEDGRLTTVVRKPNYRGVSASFWRNLQMVGSAETFRVLGTPYCGKGEPNQMVRVGHATPACLFTDVDVFGGAA
ncbi:MAG: TldD/PmbA family protein [Planctomycetes bacterium]|nr:TldD/PmbA family protein [Planctomycetota bacterium]